MRVLGEQRMASDAVYTLAVAALDDKDVHVRRAAVELMGRYIHSNAVDKLIASEKVEDFDTHTSMPSV